MALTEWVMMPGQDYKSICDSVRAKTGKTNLLKSGEVAPAIDGIVINGGVDTSTDTPAEEGDIVKGKVAFANGEKVTGAMEAMSGLYALTEANEDSSVMSNDDGSKSLLLSGKYSGTTTRYVEPGTSLYILMEDADDKMSMFGNATSEDVVKGKTFTSANGIEITGNIEHTNRLNVLGRIPTRDTKGNIELSYEFYKNSLFRDDDSIHLYSEGAKFGDATAECVAEDRTFTSANGLNIPGSLPVVSSFDLTHIDAFASGTIVEGSLVVYVENDSDAIVRSGKSVYLKVPLSSAYFGNATEDEVLAGRTFTSANGVKITGKASLGASIPEEAVVIQKVMSAQASTQVGSGYSLSLTYGDELIINDNVILAFSGTTSTLRNITESTDFSVLSNKYIRTGSTMGTSTNTFYYIPPDAIFTVGDAAYNKTLTCDKAQKVTIQKVNL